VALLIRPFTTRPSTAGFILPQAGRFVVGSSPTDEFLFRQLEGEGTVRAAAESVMQSVVTSSSLDDVLTEGRRQLRAPRLRVAAALRIHKTVQFNLANA